MRADPAADMYEAVGTSPRFVRLKTLPIRWFERPKIVRNHWRRSALTAHIRMLAGNITLVPGAGAGIPARTSVAGWLLAGVFCLINLPLAFGYPVWTLFGLFPDAVMSGAWWRVPLHAFVHVSMYHALLDGLAFFSLLAMLPESAPKRGFILMCSVAGAAAAALFDPVTWTQGYSGLSGAAHGLMGALCLLGAMDRQSSSTLRAAHAVVLAGTAAKCMWEAMTGSVVLAGLHPGSVGIPVVYSHAGGFLAGVVSVLILRIWCLTRG